LAAAEAVETGAADSGELVMGRLARWMIRLYPASWRARYGDELEALLADTGADARIVGDLARGGMRMQLKAWPFPLLALVLGIIGLLAGAGISFFVPNVYVSEAVLRIDSAHATTDHLDIVRAEQEVESRRKLPQMIAGLGLYRNDLLMEPLEDVMMEMRRHIQVDPLSIPGRGTAFRIRFDYGDRIQAQQTVDALVKSFQNQAAELKRSEAANRGQKIAVLDTASLPGAPVFPTKPVLWGGGLLAGLGIAAMLRGVFGKGGIRWFLWVATTAGILGMVMAQYGSNVYRWPNMYRSTITFVLRTADPSGAAAITAEVLNPETLSVIANDPRLQLYQRAMATEPIEDVLRGMREHVSVSTHPYGDGDGTEITLSFEYNDNFKAQQTVQSLLAKFIDAADRRLAPPVETASAAPVIEVLDRASAPESPATPNRTLAASMGGGCGVLLAGLISLLRWRWKPERQVPVDSIGA
jgi:capsular polysaccharide biosynthesis protein